MNRALYAAASGMAEQQRNLEIVAENLANADVAGFKGAVASSATAQRTIFTQGKLAHGDGPFDVAIQGEGFFMVRDANGRRAYTRDGAFSRSADGYLRTAEGWRLECVRIPENALGVTVAQDGTVTASSARGPIFCGRIRIAVFAAPESLRSSGGAVFFATRESGKARVTDAGSAFGPSIQFGMLEQSNVPIVEAMMQILAAQRAYEANAKGVQAADEMLRIADNLQRG
jgi:flagellar basal-body rod protein FlgG